MKLSYLTAVTALLASSVQAGVYDLSIDTLSVNITGKPRQALAINGQIPGPALRFKEGEDFNKLWFTTEGEDIEHTTVVAGVRFWF